MGASTRGGRRPRAAVLAVFSVAVLLAIGPATVSAATVQLTPPSLEGDYGMARPDPQRSLIRRIGAYTAHSRHDGYETTRAARAAFESKLEREVDPDGVLPVVERIRRAEMARKAYFARLALASAQARRKRQLRSK